MFSAYLLNGEATAKLILTAIAITNNHSTDKNPCVTPRAATIRPNSEKLPSAIALSKLVLDLKPNRDVMKKYNQVLIGSIKTRPIAVNTTGKVGKPCIPTDKKNPTNINSLKLNKDFDKALDFG